MTSHHSVIASSSKKKKKSGRAAARRTTNVFSMFETAQIKEFKEAFSIIDQNRDGFIDRDDLHDMLASLGKDPTEKQLDTMINEAPGPINFTMFLTLFGEKLQGTDPENVILDAFGYLDGEGTGKISEDVFREMMMTMGRRFSEEEMEEITRGAPIKNGLLDYREFTRTLKHGSSRKGDREGGKHKT
ncbi:myosin regulatory light chain 12A-like [Lytechinus variegatus]|uniref:myosin regulatory light chain 12A-like n=1 Tax=Lytechinus variegatus TaxID=7654 RepID=UPI001BB10865|nr:myosin regulatory light chain 12A-like [Lytechinus variegatus]